MIKLLIVMVLLMIFKGATITFTKDAGRWVIFFVGLLWTLFVAVIIRAVFLANIGSVL